MNSDLLNKAIEQIETAKRLLDQQQFCLAIGKVSEAIITLGGWIIERTT